jgi:hypothetical protein
MVHPDLFLSVKIKESGFFSFRHSKNKFLKPKEDGFIRDINAYAGLFKDAKENQIVGEVCTWYLYHFRETIRNMVDIYGSLHRRLKMIIILRNPIERAASQYALNVRNGYEQLHFLQAINRKTIEQRMNDGWLSGFDYIGYGMYSEQVKAYMDNFPQTKVLLFDDFVKDIQHSFNEICSFLSVNSIDVNAKVYNRSGMPVAPFVFHNILRPIKEHLLSRILPEGVFQDMKNYFLGKFSKRFILSGAERKILRDIYRQDIQELSLLIDRDLSSWLD